MNDDILKSIEVLAAKVRSKEDEANKLKKLVNELCLEAEVEPRFTDISDSGSSVGSLRSDQFYGQTLTAAIRNYLERRKASNLGAATVTDIYKAIRDGGYKFETKSEDIARISVANALRKTSSIFHRLPNGQYGLLSWYPNAKALSEDDRTSAKSKRAVKKKGDSASLTNGPVTSKEIRDTVLSLAGDFHVNDIEASVQSKFPDRPVLKSKIANILFKLKTEQKLIREVSPRSGNKGAVYAKI